jgi:hypothetical protein
VSLIPSESSTRRAHLVAWLVVIVVAVWLRFWQLHLQILLDDEWHAIHRLMRADWRDIALSFGLADYSIPLTLLFNGLYETTGLAEWHMRALPMLFGLATVVVVPVALKPWLDWRERWLLALLIALSPLLIHYTRQVRPYALVTLMGFLAMVALWRWWHDGDRRWLFLFVPAAVLSAWLHALTAVFTGAALTWFGVAGLVQWLRHGSPRRLVTVLVTGFVTVGACSALILPPLLSTPQAIAEKAGVDQIGVATVVQSWELLIGSANPLTALLILVLAACGAWRLSLRDRAFVLYWAWLVAVSTMAIMLLRPAWIHHALVFVRYNAIAHPMILALVSVGTVWLGGQFARRWPAPGGSLHYLALGGLAGLMLYLTGPLPDLYRGINQFTNGTRYQFDYDLERSPFNFLHELPVPPFYESMAEEPGDWEVVEAPWHFETSMSPLSEYQRVHGRPVRIGMISGLCVDWTWGEVQPAARDRLRLPRFVFLSDLVDGEVRPGNLFVILRMAPAFEPVRELPSVEGCVAAMTERFGSPWFEDDRHVVFRLPASSGAE